VFGILWDCIFISDRQADKKKGGWMEFGINIETDFARTVTRRSETDIDEFLYDARRRALSFLSLRDSGLVRWTRNDKMCHWMGGCAYREVCSHNLNQALLDTTFVKKVWEPWRGITEPDTK